MDLSANHILTVFLLTTLAGLATGIGGFIAFFMKKTDTKAGRRGFYKPENRMRKIVCRIGFPEKTVIFATNYTSNP